jgi:hypothetical protein
MKRRTHHHPSDDHHRTLLRHDPDTTSHSRKVEYGSKRFLAQWSHTLLSRMCPRSRSHLGPRTQPRSFSRCFLSPRKLASGLVDRSSPSLHCSPRLTKGHPFDGTSCCYSSHVPVQEAARCCPRCNNLFCPKASH